MVKLAAGEEFMTCPKCGAKNSKEGLDSRLGKCYRCRITLVMDEFDVRALRTMLDNNQIGQTLSTLELLARHGVCTTEMNSIKVELDLELASRREEEAARQARLRRKEMREAFRLWFDMDNVADTIIEALEDRGYTPTIEKLKDIWTDSCLGLDEFISGSIAEEEE